MYDSEYELEYEQIKTYDWNAGNRVNEVCGI